MWNGNAWENVGRIQGFTGSQGIPGGVSFEYLYPKETPLVVGDPGLGAIIFNNFELDQTEEIFLSLNDRFGNLIESYLENSLSSTSQLKGFIKISNKFQSSRYAIFRLNSFVAFESYYRILVDFILSSVSEFNSLEELILSFDRSGDQGFTGSIGFTGSQGQDGVQGYTGSLGESSFTYSSTPPPNPTLGDRWFDSAVGAENVWTVDIDGSAQWVEVAASGFLGLRGFTGSSGFGSVDLNTRSYTGDGLTRVFGVSPNLSVDTALVFVNGESKAPGVDYTVIDSNLTFTVAPSNNSNIVIREIISTGGSVINDIKVVATGLSIVFGL